MVTVRKVPMTKARGRVQQEKGLVVVGPALPDAPAPRWSPDPERVEDFPVNLPLLGMGRIIGRQGLDIGTGRLAEFSISAQVEYQGGWSEVAQIDTAHEEVHGRNVMDVLRAAMTGTPGTHPT